MAKALDQAGSIIHEAANADFDNYSYNRVYAASEKKVEINGTVVLMTKGLVLPVMVRRNQIESTSGNNLDDIYLIGNVVSYEDTLGHDK